MTSWTEVKDLQIGTAYEVQIEDCCVSGTIQLGKLLRRIGGPDYPDLVFEHGTMTGHMGAEYREMVPQ